MKLLPPITAFSLSFLAVVCIWGADTYTTTRPAKITIEEISPPSATLPAIPSDYEQPPVGAIIVRSGQQPPTTLTNATLALERGAKASGTIELKGLFAVIVPFGDRTKPYFELSAPSTKDSGIFSTGCNKISITGISLVPTNTNEPKRPEGIGIRGSTRTIQIHDVWVSKFDNNVVIEGNHKDVDITGLRTSYAWGTEDFHGQGLYISGTSGAVTISDSLFYHNGKADNMVDKRTNAYRHGVYQQSDNNAITYSRCMFVDNVNAGTQSRTSANIHNCFYGNNAINIFGVGGTLTISDSVVAGSHLFWNGSSWIGNVAMMLYCPTTTNNLLIVGANPHTEALPVYQVPVDKNKPNGPKKASRYVLSGCIAMSKTYSPHPEWSRGASLNTTNTRILGWQGPLVAGDAAPRALPAGCISRTTTTPPSLSFTDLVALHLRGDETACQKAIDRATTYEKQEP